MGAGDDRLIRVAKEIDDLREEIENLKNELRKVYAQMDVVTQRLTTAIAISSGISVFISSATIAVIRRYKEAAKVAIDQVLNFAKAF